MKQPLISSELSWLYFNQCIIDEAAGHTNALYERIKFLAIFSSNLDEFFRVGVGVGDYLPFQRLRAPLVEAVSATAFRHSKLYISDGCG